MGGTQSAPKITAQDRAILDMKLQRDKLKQYQLQIQGVLKREHEIALAQLAAGNKDRALVALRRKKYQETLLVKTDGQLEQLEQLVSSVEFSLVQVSVYHGLKQGNEVLKEIHKELSIENVEKLMDETHEAREYQREVNETLRGQLSLDEEDEVQEELARLQAEALPNVPVPVSETEPVLPTPPHDIIEDEDEPETPASVNVREPEHVRQQRVALEA